MESLSVSTANPSANRHRSTAAINHLRSYCSSALARLASFFRHLLASLPWIHRSLALRVDPFFHHLFYFLTLAFAASVALLLLDNRLPDRSPKYIDLLYMSVSAVTVSGLNSVELEVFSTAQVMVLTLLMLFGGEVFLSLLTLTCRSHKPEIGEPARVDPVADPEAPLDLARIDSAAELTRAIRRRCISALTVVVLVYLLSFHVAGTVVIALYLRFAPSARRVLKSKGLPLLPFAISTTVSSFANGGLIWTNENMMIFLKNSGLLITIIILVFVGNTMYPSALRAVVYAFYKATGKEEYRYMLRNPEKLSFVHLKSKRKTFLVAASVAGLWGAQLVLLLSMDWGKSFYDGLSSFQRLVSGMFQAANTRHCGESSIDVSQVSAAALVIVIFAMFLPAYASFQPEESEGVAVVARAESEPEKSPWRWLKIASMPQSLYVTVFVLVVCLIERRNITGDPINYSFLFVVFEVVSAYGNVGLSTGYGCSKRLNAESSCTDLFISLSGKWSTGGKLVIMFVMIFGRLKKFHLRGGRSWRMQ